MGVVRAGREGRDGRAVLSALFGGIVAVGALMFLSAAMIMGMIWSGTPPDVAARGPSGTLGRPRRGSWAPIV